MRFYKNGPTTNITWKFKCYLIFQFCCHGKRQLELSPIFSFQCQTHQSTTWQFKLNKKFSTIQPSIDVTGIRNERWQWRKRMPFFWLHAPSWIGQSKLKLLSRNWISILSNSDLDLDHIHLGSNPKLHLDVSYPYTNFGVNRPKQTKVIERKLNFYF